MKRAVIFDLDGLLIDSEVVSHQLMDELLRQYGYSLTKAEYARIADAYFAREITRETLGSLPERYTPEERAEAAFARREQTERALFEWLFGQYARRCPVQYQIPAFLAGVACVPKALNDTCIVNHYF